ncbi:hypothetical protein PR048_017305 [Dryococelus australis]|uniref:Uncharacterized protein n=1 Tax=Dryococelus australis TaxID=614101 RepID=A0ABQ9H956_9NEOP|nr:hypothetical protein PR048_017305 [Dryococelus australis]
MVCASTSLMLNVNHQVPKIGKESVLKKRRFRNLAKNFQNTCKHISEKYQPPHISPWKDEKRTHNFLTKWFREYPWLCYSEKLKGVVCYECTEAIKKKLMSQHNKSVLKLINGEGLKNWKNAESRFNNHEKSQTHKEAVVKIIHSALNLLFHKFVWCHKLSSIMQQNPWKLFSNH